MGLFGGGDVSQSQATATGQSQASINSSGWSVGSGSAGGGGLSSSSSGGGFSLPWYGFASLGIIALAWLKYRGRK